MGTLTLVCTPIGNLSDLSPRVVEALKDADFWIVEDSRVSGKLAAHLGVKKPMKVLHGHSSSAKVEDLVQQLHNASAALLTDGGAPGVSDPGAILVDACHEEEIEIDAIPGPSAVTNALMLSGFFAQRYAFLGFLPRKPGPIRKELEMFVDSPITLVLFESPHRFRALLKVAGEVLGDRRYAICREMTKMHQQVFRQRLPYVPNESEVPGKGEFTLVIEGQRKTLGESDAEWYDTGESA